MLRFRESTQESYLIKRCPLCARFTFQNQNCSIRLKNNFRSAGESETCKPPGYSPANCSGNTIPVKQGIQRII